MRRLNKKGFTLIELLIVVVILGVLIAIVIGATTGNKDRANDSKRKADLSRIQVALEDCYADAGAYATDPYTDTCVMSKFEGGTLPTDPEGNAAYTFAQTTVQDYTLTATLSDASAFTLQNKQ